MNIWLQHFEYSLWRVFLENANRIDTFECGQNFRARDLFVYRPRFAFETSHRFVGVDEHDQAIAQGARLLQELHMADV